MVHRLTSGATAGAPETTQDADRRMLLWAVPGALASAALGSYLGYLCSPHLSHPSIVQDLEICGMVIGGCCLIFMLICCAMAFAPARPAAGQEEAAEEDEKKEPTETPYDFRANRRARHRALIWAVPVTLAFAALGSVLEYLGYPGIYAAHQSVGDNLELGFGGLVSFGAIFLIGGCAYAAWPARVFGPKRAPQPWVLPLKLIGYWLAMLPFSLFSLAALAGGIDEGVNGAWLRMIILLIIAFVFGAACCFLLAGSGALQGEELKPGGEVSGKVRQSSWWRHFKTMLTLWALLLTVVAMVSAVQRDWSNCTDFGGAAVGSWLARLKAAGGEMPEETFQA